MALTDSLLGRHLATDEEAEQRVGVLAAAEKTMAELPIKR
jgi:hypothetical protein